MTWKSTLKNLFVYPAKYLDSLSGGRINANLVTIFGLILHIPIAWLIISNHLLYAAVLLVIAALCDGLDGALARLQQKQTDLGAWLDACSDRLGEIIVFGAIIYYLTQNQEAPLLIALAGLSLGLSLLVSYVKAKGEALIANRQRHIKKLNNILSGGLLNYEQRLIILIIILVSQIWLWGFIVLSIGSIVTITWRGYKFYKHIKGS